MEFKKYLTKYGTLICFSLLILISLFPVSLSETVTHFKKPDSTVGQTDISYLIKMDSKEDLALEASGYFEIPSHRGEITSAALKIKCEGEDDSYLSDPRLDIGLDGDYEWRFDGKGYGNAGHQTVFSSGFGKRSVITAKRGTENYDNRSYILLPTTADVKDASMKIKGGPGQFTEDLVVAMYYSGNIYYTKSNRDGTFGSVVSYYDVTSGYSYGSIGLGDFDGDNDLDIVYGEGYWMWGNLNFYIIENINGNPHPWGNTPSRKYIASVKVSGTNYYPYNIAVEDFDGDGNLDFVGSVRNGNLYFFKGEGDLNFNIKKLAVTYPGSYSMGKDAADINNDGLMDFVAGGTTTATVYYYEGIGNGSFEPGVGINTGQGYNQYGLVTADFNDDYDVDILTKGYGSGTGASTYMKFIGGNGDGTFNDPIDSNLNLGSYYQYGVSDAFDFNYDGYQDVIGIRSGSLYYYEGLGTGDFKTGDYLGYASSSYGVAAPPRMPLGGCQNLKLDIGDDGTTEKTFSGTFDGSMTQTITLKNELNSLISNPNNKLKVIIDEWGNEMYKIPLRFDSDTIGSVQLEELTIKYDYTATVGLLPGNRFNLTTDLNDLLPIDNNASNIVKVYFGVYSDTAGKATLSDLEIEFNGAPKYNDFTTISVNEDSKTSVLNLTEFNTQGKPMYFYDDYDVPTEMTYGIYSISEPEHLKLSISDDLWLQVDSTISENWYGTATARIWCQDTEGIETVSNEFTINVLPVNDKPIPNNPIPNIELQEGMTVTPVDLDDPVKEYFMDVDSDKLYFRAVLVDPEVYGEKMTVSVDADTNLLRIASLKGFGQKIEVKVYCDDEIGINSLSLSELELIEAYQIVFVNITSSTATFPPEWLPITIPPIPEDEPSEMVLRLTHYVRDPDDAVSNLTFGIYSISQSGYLDVIIDGSNYLNLYPKLDFDGTAKVTLLVMDNEHNQDLTTVDVTILPSNDLPLVEIVEPRNGSMVHGQVEIIGSAYDAEGALAKVELRVGDDGDWVPVKGLTYWTYNLNVDEYLLTHKGAQMVLIKARAEDETGNRSLLDKTYLYIRQPTADTDGDGVQDHIDRFPDNPYEWEDSDDDGFGDNSDKFRKDETQWNDTDGDGYGDNPDGNNPDIFPYDPTQWNDLDRDGHGDNPWGNSGDNYPNDPEQWQKEGATEDLAAAEKDALVYLGIVGLLVVIILTVLVFLFLMINWMRNKKNEKGE